MHADPVIDAARHYDALYAAQEAREHAEAVAAGCFLDACRKADANAAANFAGLVTDWNAVRKPLAADAMLPKRVMSLHEVLSDACTYNLGPDISEVWQLVLNVAAGRQPREALEQQANALLRRAADAWAHNNVEVE